MRIPIVRRLQDDTVVDGTADVRVVPGGIDVTDFRDLDGHPLALPPGASFEFTIADPNPEGA